MDDPGWYGIGSLGLRRNSRPDLSVILPELLIGEYVRPDDVEWLRATHAVTAVLSMQDDADLASKGLELRALECAYRQHGLRFERIAVADCDSEALGAQLERLVSVLAELLGGGRVYLHCNAGMNRAPTTAIAYLHVHCGLTLIAARDFVKQRRHCVPYMRVLEAQYGGASCGKRETIKRQT